MDLILILFKKIFLKFAFIIIPSFKYRKVGFSQNGEDSILPIYLHCRKKGFYIDIGCSHPIEYSNTYYFYKRGWKGICIDASDQFANDYKKYRPNDLFIHSGVGAKEEKLNFNFFEQNKTNSFKNIGDKKVVKTIPTQIKTLESILNEYVNPGSEITFLNIDVEGLDFDVLKGNNWTKYRPDYLIIEKNNVHGMKSVLNTDICKYLKTKRYWPISLSYCSMIFESYEAIDRRPKDHKIELVKNSFKEYLPI